MEGERVALVERPRAAGRPATRAPAARPPRSAAMRKKCRTELVAAAPSTSTAASSRVTTVFWTNVAPRSRARASATVDRACRRRRGRAARDARSRRLKARFAELLERARSAAIAAVRQPRRATQSCSRSSRRHSSAISAAVKLSALGEDALEGVPELDDAIDVVGGRVSNRELGQACGTSSSSVSGSADRSGISRVGGGSPPRRAG